MTQMTLVETTTQKKIVQLILCCLGLLFFDQLSKWYVFNYIPLIDQIPYQYPYGGIPVFKDFLGIEFSINYLTNTGAAWGFLGHYQFALVVLRVLLIIGLIVYFIKCQYAPFWKIPLMLIIAGAIGNVLDYFFYGHVVDMLHFILWGYDFPVFNVADSSITIGIALLFIFSWFKRE